MNRKSTDVEGWVAFPVNDPAWKNTFEGGMLVKLVVCDNRDFDTQLGVCCGANVFDVMSETFVGDDKCPQPLSPIVDESDPEALLAALAAEQKAQGEWVSRHYPRYADASVQGIEQYTSRPYVAAMVIGSTGWSGSRVEDHQTWVCTFEDLTEEGKALYRQLQKLYQGCDIHLLTFLDT
ncbi:TPA: hypothetical protein ACP3ZG_000540 [Pseudomonas aeruginosa]|uniref:Uncharacterized protein n=1 Tax=Pseudomonas aeruginosa TaxID=287 RepID=A0A241XRL7_PSEAI|nr:MULTISPECIES: hypothetical protein [Pseudomonas]ELG7184131.1 hypothetical protein [Pseudomonas aeruginosa]MBI6602691.1 hypothetical protein [Pseudomonas sp. S4_EA_1b]MBI8852296.1 hypothetical protein [Pseudomonas aeruginosa]OBY57092.1 hypothetical protein A9513_016400 [Pseudomonas sp. AU12215]OTI63057.1 hypothetical protein CAZ10_09450 [Pseudomonas aeruginosa]